MSSGIEKIFGRFFFLIQTKKNIFSDRVDLLLVNRGRKKGRISHLIAISRKTKWFILPRLTKVGFIYLDSFFAPPKTSSLQFLFLSLSFANSTLQEEHTNTHARGVNNVRRIIIIIHNIRAKLLRFTWQFECNSLNCRWWQQPLLHELEVAAFVYVWQNVLVLYGGWCSFTHI